MSDPMVKGLAFASVYATDFQRAYRFYSEALGLEKQFDMGDLACFFALPDDTGLYLQGGNDASEISADSQRAAFVFAVASAGQMYARLEAAGAAFVHEAPVHMGGENYWFQFTDPDGNILEAVGPA